tara:strand:+ start:1323 stop:1886 length:564 start_codon:yes stop_codon:yes gene_type:complete
MRIISGKFKGKKLIEPLDKKTRPLKDLTKESIFNLIEHSKYINFNLEKSLVLDLFSGSGSFGLECLSRNAKHTTFVENYRPAINVLRKNANNLNLNDEITIIDKDIFNIKISKYFENKYNLIFLDPPYSEKNISALFLLILNQKLLKKTSLIIIHRNKKSNDIFPKEFKIIETRSYGVSKIIFLKLR